MWLLVWRMANCQFGVVASEGHCLNVTVEHAQAMHATVKSFMETDFASYLRLGDLDIAGLHQLCDDPDTEEGQPEGGSSHTGTSSTPQ